MNTQYNGIKSIFCPRWYISINLNVTFNLGVKKRNNNKMIEITIAIFKYLLSKIFVLNIDLLFFKLKIHINWTKPIQINVKVIAACSANSKSLLTK